MMILAFIIRKGPKTLSVPYITTLLEKKKRPLLQSNLGLREGFLDDRLVDLNELGMLCQIVKHLVRRRLFFGCSKPHPRRERRQELQVLLFVKLHAHLLGKRVRRERLDDALFEQLRVMVKIWRHVLVVIRA